MDKPSHVTEAANQAALTDPVFRQDIHGMLARNASVLDLLDSSYMYANADLLKHYGISRKGKKVSGSLRRYDVEEGSHRGGVLTMGAVLAVSSYPHRTSPVLRGKWLMEKILGAPRCKLGDEVGCRRRNQNQVRPFGQFDMTHCCFSLLVPDIAAHRFAGHGLEDGR